MQIAFLQRQFPNLSTTFLLDQVTGLLDRGHDVEIFASHRGTEHDAHPDVARYGLLDRTTYYPSMPSQPAAVYAKGAGLAARNLLRQPVNTLRSLNAARFGRHAYSLRLLYAADAFAPGRSFDVVHAHFGPPGLRAALLRDAGVLRGPLVTTFYGHDVTHYPLIHGRDVYLPLFERGDRFLALSEVMRDQLIALGAPPEKTFVHHLGVPAERFAYHPRTAPESGPVRLLTVGRLAEKKGIAFGLRAYAALADAFPNTHYTIIGGGPLRAELEALKDDLGLADRVTFAGPKKRPDVIAALNDAHLFLAPSVLASNNDAEGTPTVIAEAMASGLPVVSTFHSGIPEMVIDGKTGRLVPERDVEALAAALGDLLRNPSAWAAMSAAGRAQALAEFDMPTLTQKLEAHYAAVPR